MKIGRDDTSASCGLALPAGTRAYWFADERVVRCQPCHEVESQAGGPEQVQDDGGAGANVTTIDPATAPTPDSDPMTDVAGRSAQSEYDRRSARELARKQKRVEEDAEWRASIKESRPMLGQIASALTPKPEIGPESQSTKAWKAGAEGERRVAEVLAEAVGVEVLHDRRVPGSKANIDHVAVGPAGVFVIDAKKYTGQVEVRDVGCRFRADERLYVNNRDRTKLVDGVAAAPAREVVAGRGRVNVADQCSTGGVALRHLHPRELKPPDSGTVADVAAASLLAAVAARRTARALQ